LADGRRGEGAALAEFLDELPRMVGIDRDEQAPRGLGVERELEALGVDTRLDPEQATGNSRFDILARVK
jgi:hypothetical protein